MAWFFGSSGSAEGVGQTIAFGKRRVKLQRQLAEGGYAVVFEGVDARTRERFAVKRIITADEESRERAEHEVAIHERLGCEVHHVVGYHGCARLPRRDGGLDVFLLLELCAGGHLWAWCTRDGASAMSARQRLATLAEVADGLAAMHALPLAHNDLKLENVLVREGGSAAWANLAILALAANHSRLRRPPAGARRPLWALEQGYGRSAPAVPPSRLSGPGAAKGLGRFDNPGSVALCDFGSASSELTEAGPLPRQERLRLQDRLERFTTPMYRAPEMVDLYSALPCGTAADLWALGRLRSLKAASCGLVRPRANSWVSLGCGSVRRASGWLHALRTREDSPSRSPCAKA